MLASFHRFLCSCCPTEIFAVSPSSSLRKQIWSKSYFVSRSLRNYQCPGGNEAPCGSEIQPNAHIRTPQIKLVQRPGSEQKFLILPEDASSLSFFVSIFNAAHCWPLLPSQTATVQASCSQAPFSGPVQCFFVVAQQLPFNKINL